MILMIIEVDAAEVIMSLMITIMTSIIVVQFQ